MANGNARWTPTFALWLGIGSAVALAVVVGLVQGVHLRAPTMCVDSSISSWRAAPWALIAVIPSLVFYLVKTVAARAPQVAMSVGEGPYRVSVANTKTQFGGPPFHDYLRGLIALLAVVGAVAQSRKWCELSLPATCHPALKKIVLVPVGPIDPSEVSGLVKHFVECYGLPISLGNTVTPPATAYDPQRKQWIAGSLLDAIPACKIGDPACEATTLTIGITDYDIYMTEYTMFNWIYTARNDERHTEIISTFRMSLKDGYPERASKIVARDIALDYCGIPISNDRKSIVGPQLGGQNDLDDMNESIW